MHIGKKIKTIMEQRNRSVIWVAKQLECERTNIYNIFARADINTRLLRQLCTILEYNFFKDLADETAKK